MRLVKRNDQNATASLKRKSKNKNEKNKTKNETSGDESDAMLSWTEQTTFSAHVLWPVTWSDITRSNVIPSLSRHPIAELTSEKKIEEGGGGRGWGRGRIPEN